MCGLLIVSGQHKDFDRAFDRVKHRGVRQRVEYHPRGVVGHSRLPIVGLDERFDQPVVHGDFTIAYVGEVLNFRNLRPHHESDLPLMVEAFATNRSLLRTFDGFWLVAALDQGTGQIHVMTDYLAQKPGYYRSDAHAVAVSSEPAALVELGPVTPDEVYLSSVVKWGYCPETWRTPYLQVRKTLPGEYVVLSRNFAPRRWIEDELRPTAVGSPTLLRQEVEAAVERRVLSSDVPVACLLSGGLDSSIVYTLARRHGTVQPYHFFNGDDELSMFNRITKGDLNAYVLTRGDPVTNTRALLVMQEPIDLGSLKPQIELSDAIARAGGERVCLTGDGADELFGGYGRAQRYDSQASDVWHELVAWHLPRLDRVMMRNRVEVRSPFLARRVVEIALALPYELRRGKRVLRDLFRDVLPEGFADQEKRPLRTAEVEHDREAVSLALVEQFRRMTWPPQRKERVA